MATEDNFCISMKYSFPAPGKAGHFNTYHPKDQTETIVSINPDGKIETRPVSAAGGAWESWQPSPDGMRAIFYDLDGVVRAYPLVP
jgi:hypothetical protein